jgi:uncharacterized protein YdeI (YjbR/CyaY-like superfamily)
MKSMKDEIELKSRHCLFCAEIQDVHFIHAFIDYYDLFFHPGSKEIRRGRLAIHFP